MSNSDVLNALDVLVEYPDLQEYIKKFNHPGGFMYTIETDEKHKRLTKRLDDLLDPYGRHSGASWGCMMRGVQAILNGEWSYEQLLEQAAEEDEHMSRMRAKNAELRKARLAEEETQ
jgi:hypothetical protein